MGSSAWINEVAELEREGRFEEARGVFEARTTRRERAAVRAAFREVASALGGASLIAGGLRREMAKVLGLHEVNISAISRVSGIHPVAPGLALQPFLDDQTRTTLLEITSNTDWPLVERILDGYRAALANPEHRISQAWFNLKVGEKTPAEVAEFIDGLQVPPKPRGRPAGSRSKNRWSSNDRKYWTSMLDALVVALDRRIAETGERPTPAARAVLEGAGLTPNKAACDYLVRVRSALPQPSDRRKK